MRNNLEKLAPIFAGLLVYPLLYLTTFGIVIVNPNSSIFTVSLYRQTFLLFMLAFLTSFIFERLDISDYFLTSLIGSLGISYHLYQGYIDIFNSSIALHGLIEHHLMSAVILVFYNIPFTYYSYRNREIDFKYILFYIIALGSYIVISYQLWNKYIA